MLCSLPTRGAARSLGRCAWAVAVALAVVGDAAAQPVRRLFGQAHQDAVAARDRADQQRAAMEQAVAADRKAAEGKSDPKKARELAAPILRAYQDVIARYPHTDVAADCATAVAGVHQFLGDFDEAAKVAAKTAAEFAGTRLAGKTAFTTGLIHASARHDPAEAIKWFARVPKPVKPPGSPYDEDDKYYLAAQQQMIKCELQLREDAAAAERADRLKRAVPQYADQIDRQTAFEAASRDGTDGAGLGWASDRYGALRVGLSAGGLVLLVALAVWQIRRTRTRTGGTP